MADLKRGSVSANGIRFHYLEMRDGEMGDGPLVLCMHGFPDSAHSFDFLLPELAAAGFRAVAPFMRGYSPTEPPQDGRYQTALLSQDVVELVGALGFQQAVLVGHDWGAWAVLGAAVLAPEKITRLVTLASAHPAAGERRNYSSLKGSWHAFYFQLADAEATVAHDDFAFIEEWWRDTSPEWDIPRGALEEVKHTFRQPGVVQAALGYYRHSYNPSLRDPALAQTQARLDSAPVRVPTLALHGTRDRPRRLEAFEAMDNYFTGGLQKVVVPGTGHFMHREKPWEVNPRVVEFLKT